MKYKNNLIPETMKKVTPIFIAVCLAALISQAQQVKSPLGIEIYQLENGLTVYLNEDHSLPSVFGAVAVKGGSKRDPEDATGIAHYFEHIMFKGTDSIGTLDYPSEKVYLDSIAGLYDELAETRDEEGKAALQKEINRLSIKASGYAIPNELDKILSEMGGTKINAGTGNEEIVYYNIFPTNQIEKWLKVYSNRFENPVYRLFQTELETVYEEYNMYKDNRFSNALEEYSKAIYPDHPYGRPVIGLPEHLKSPSMEKMNAYFQTYYVANNMALVLSGNFNTDEVKPMISEYFGEWRSGEIPAFPSKYSIQPFKGKELIQKKLTPVKFGIRTYRSVSTGHEDAAVLDVIHGLLTNESSTGLIDDLVVENKLMATGSGGNRFLEAGTEMVLFVPKIVGQSLEKAENLIDNEIDSLKSGNFDDELLEAVKTNIIVNYERTFEDQYGRGYMMITSFVKERDWKDILGYTDKIKSITKEDVLKAANKYFGNDYLTFYSKTGFPKKPKSIKPSFDPIPSVNTDKKSVYAQKIENMQIPETVPDFIEFGPPGKENSEVTIADLNPMTHLYYTENKVNDLFDLTIRFGIGSYELPVLNQVSEYMKLIGSEKHTFRELSSELQKLGATYEFNTSNDYFDIKITGIDMYFEKTLKLVSELIYTPKPDEKKIRKLYEYIRTNEKVEQKDPETLGYALYLYAVYGKQSPFINRLSVKEVKNLSPDTLLNTLKKIIRYEAEIHYSGTIGLTDLEDQLKSNLQLDRIQMKSNSPVKKEYRIYTEPVVYFMNDKKAIQSKNYFFIPGDQVNENEKAYLNSFHDYLDGGMQSVIFQEVRELRSLAYSSGAAVYNPFYPDEKTSLIAYVGTQADKTKEAVDIMHQIICNPPDKSDRIELVRKSLIQSINSNKAGFRTISQKVASLCKRNYLTDPEKNWVETYKTMNFNDIVSFYNKQFYNKPVVTTIIGDESLIGKDWMKTYGKIIEVRKKDIFR